MTSGEAKRYVVGAVVVSGALAGVSDLVQGQVPKVRIIAGAAIAGVILAIAAEPAPDLAGMLALLMLAGAIFTAGAPTFQAIGRIVSPPARPATARVDAGSSVGATSKGNQR